MPTEKENAAAERRRILLTITLSTLLFALAVAAVFGVVYAAARSRLRRIDDALAAGRFDAAETMIAALADEGKRTAYENRLTYERADAALSAGEYEAAAGLFTSLGGYSDAAERSREAVYRLGEAALSRGDYARAQELFLGLGSYADAAEMAKKSVYLRAESCLGENRLYESFQLFRSLADYSDAEERTLALAERIVGRRDAEAALARVSGLSPSELQRRDRLALLRQTADCGLAAAGFYHTAALRSDGTVLACGDNTWGQCDTGGWRDAVSVCAGAYHTAALLSDGTVVAAGRNDEGQCDVSGWTDIVAVTAADGATFGLRADGTVVACGYNAYYMLDSWTDIVRISGGSYALAALRADGTALISHESARSDELRELADIAVNTGYAVGVRPDGTVVCSGLAPTGWENIVTAAAGSSAVLGLTADGEVLARFFRAGDELDFSGLHGITALAAGGTHYVFVGRDGRVTALGDNSRGQCETALWDLG